MLKSKPVTKLSIQ